MCKKCKNFLVLYNILLFFVRFCSLSLCNEFLLLFLYWISSRFIHKNRIQYNETLVYWIHKRKRVREGWEMLRSLHTHIVSYYQIIISLASSVRSETENRHNNNNNGFFILLPFLFGFEKEDEHYFDRLDDTHNNSRMQATTVLDIVTHINSYNVIKITKIMFDLKGFSSLCRKIDTNTIWFIPNAFFVVVISFRFGFGSFPFIRGFRRFVRILDCFSLWIFIRFHFDSVFAW